MDAAAAVIHRRERERSGDESAHVRCFSFVPTSSGILFRLDARDMELFPMQARLTTMGDFHIGEGGRPGAGHSRGVGAPHRLGAPFLNQPPFLFSFVFAPKRERHMDESVVLEFSCFVPTIYGGPLMSSHEIWTSFADAPRLCPLGGKDFRFETRRAPRNEYARIGCGSGLSSIPILIRERECCRMPPTDPRSETWLLAGNQLARAEDLASGRDPFASSSVLEPGRERVFS